MNPIAQRIAARRIAALTHRHAQGVGDPKELLEAFGSRVKAFFSETDWHKLAEARAFLENMQVHKLTEKMSTDKALQDQYHEADRLAMKAAARYHVTTFLRPYGLRLFLSILQSFALPPALRKKVEMASREYGKKNAPSRSGYGIAGRIKDIDDLTKYHALVQGHLQLAHDAIQSGQVHATEGEGATRVPAGCFTLVNAGGFSPEQVKTVQELATKADHATHAAGVGQVCYGTIQVNNTVGPTNSMAFYLPDKDEMFVRGNAKPTWDTLETILHELGHRYANKFLKLGKSGLNWLYQNIRMHELARSMEDRAEIPTPKPGDAVKLKSGIFRVKSVEYVRGRSVINLEQNEKSGENPYITMDVWKKLHTPKIETTHPDFKGFVTEYAKRGGPGENFAEMFAYYCLKKLPAAQVELFEKVLSGNLK